MSKTALCALAMAGFASATQAADFDSSSLKDSIPDTAASHGIILYGAIDTGVAYQTHGALPSGAYVSGLEYTSTHKNLNGPIATLAPNAFEQSKAGIKGEEDLGCGLAVIFKLETGFNPLSGELADGLASIVRNNYVSTSSQNSWGDSSRAGQLFNGEAYAGLSSPAYGTIMAGRLQSLNLDALDIYDPQHRSYAFSAALGAGDTEDARWDDSVKYVYQYGPVRAAAMYSPGCAGCAQQGIYQFDVRGDYLGLSVDAGFSYVKGAVSASILANQAESIAGIGFVGGNQVQGTVSDNTGFGFLGKYAIGPVTFYAGYQQVQYADPKSPVAAGTPTVGGYLLGFVNNQAYVTDKILRIEFGGVKYAFTPDFAITGAYYHREQNAYAGYSYSTSSNALAFNGPCTSSEHSNCSGTFDAVSLVAEYQVSKFFDLYAGVMYSTAADGLASGYLNNNTVTPVIGGVYKF